jgi:hypothetical protein
VEGAAEGGVQDVDEAGAAVGDREEREVVVRGGTPPAHRDGLRRRRGPERAAERVRRDDHPHGPQPRRVRAP